MINGHFYQTFLNSVLQEVEVKDTRQLKSKGRDHVDSLITVSVRTLISCTYPSTHLLCMC